MCAAAFLPSSIYSQDPGSKDNCGDLGCQGRELFVTDFSAAAFKLKPGEISEIVETEFGYHIIKMEERQGDKACLKHILIIPPVTNTNLVEANKKLDSIRAQIVAGTLSFCDAADKYSDDEMSSKICGDLTNDQTGTAIFEVADLDPEIYYAIENIKPGEVSQVLSYSMPDGNKAVRIVTLKSQTEPHIANLKDDYARLQGGAMNQKQIQILNDWMEEKLQRTYLHIDTTYSGCENINNLNAIANSSR